MKKVMVFVAFDGLHPGHLYFFAQAKKYGDYLIVSVGTDKNVKKIKGKAPLFNQEERLELVGAIDTVNEAVLGAESDFYSHIRQYQPSVICLGYDQWADEDEVRESLAKVGLTETEVVRLKPHKVQKAKSTIVKNHSVDF
ncbi:FAD synthase [Candidatus Curtissbacteria bacterium]|nr:FAD synthase [Candidatus Curtissbacteria bacterium]